MRRLSLLFALALPMTAPAINIELNADQQASFNIQVASPVPSTFTQSHPYPAQIRVPNDQLRVVAAPQGGVIEALLSAEGEPVEKDQALARILSPGILELQRQFVEANTARSLAHKNLARNRSLNTEGIISERRLLESLAEYQMRDAALDQTRQALVLSGMDQTALSKLKRTGKLGSTLLVRTPIDGVVLEQMATTGQRINSADPLYSVARLDPLWVEVHVPLEAAQQVLPGDAVTLKNEQLTGRITTIGKMVHEADQGVLIRANIANPDGLLRPGQFVQVLLNSTANDSYDIPSQAVVRHQGQSHIFVRTGSGFQSTTVTLLATHGQLAQVRAAITPASEVVISGTAALKAIWLEGEE